MNSTNRSLTSALLNPGSQKNRFSKDTRFLLTWLASRKWSNHCKDNFKYNQLCSILQLVVPGQSAGSLRGSSDFSKTSGNIARHTISAMCHHMLARLLSSSGVFSPLPSPQTHPSAQAARLPHRSPGADRASSPHQHLMADAAPGQPHAGGGFCTDTIFCSNRHSQLLLGNRT